MLEVKQDALEASFDALERQDEEVEALKAEMAQLKARVDAQVVASARPALSGATARKSAFVESYLRKGVESGVELKAIAGTSEAAINDLSILIQRTAAGRIVARVEDTTGPSRSTGPRPGPLFNAPAGSIWLAFSCDLSGREPRICGLGRRRPVTSTSSRRRRRSSRERG